MNEMRLEFEEKEEREEKEEEEEEGNGDTIPRGNNGGALYLMSMEGEDDESFAFFVLSPLYFSVGLYIANKRPIIRTPRNEAQKSEKIIEEF